MLLLVEKGHQSGPWHVVQDNHVTVLCLEELTESRDASLSSHYMQDFAFAGRHFFSATFLFIFFIDNFSSHFLPCLFRFSLEDLNREWVTSAKLP